MTIQARIMDDKYGTDFGWSVYDSMEQAVERIYTVTGMPHEVACQGIHDAQMAAEERGLFAWPFNAGNGFIVEVANH